MLPRCLAAVAPAVDEIVIVDTGSTDRTIEIAREFSANVIEREWTGSFSDARNASFEAATGDWIVYLDADEVLVADDVEDSAHLTGRTGARPSTSSRPTTPASSATAPPSPTTRCACSATGPHYRFEGRLHEQIAQHLPDLRRRPARAELGPDRALRLPRRRPRRQGEVAAQPRAAEGPAGREPVRRRSCTSTSAPSTRYRRPRSRVGGA